MQQTTKKFLKDSVGWGIILWLVGYVLGIVLFAFVPAGILGWVISPIGVMVTLWVLVKKIKGDGRGYYFKVALVWTLIAVLFDYLFLVLVFKPVGGYYKLDVYFYYVVTFLLPVVVGYFKKTGE